MKRRQFINTTGAGMAGILAAGVAPAFAQGGPEIKWRLASSFAKSLDTIYGAAEYMSKRIAAATNNKFQIQLFASGEIVPGLQALDAVQNGTVQVGHTAPYYYWGKDPAFALDTAIPFGLNARQMNAWQIFGLPAGNTGSQMGGWYRKEINTPDDLKGLKMRIGGFAGAVIAKLGAVPQQIAGGDIYPALEKGTLDACEWVGPYDDEKLGFYKVARNYYYPGWWEGSAMLHVFTGLEKWNSLPKTYQAIVRAAANRTNEYMMARYDIYNPAALKRLVAAGTQLRPFPESVLDACFKASNEVYADINAKNEDFKKVYEAMKALRADQYLWFQLSENTFDTYMMIQQRKKTL